jgi:hypothetical protein
VLHFKDNRVLLTPGSASSSGATRTNTASGLFTRAVGDLAMAKSVSVTINPTHEEWRRRIALDQLFAHDGVYSSRVVRQWTLRARRPRA